MQMQDRVFVITGAGSGLGAAVARMAVDAGARVMVLDIDAEAGRATVDALGKAARFQRCDVTSAAEGEVATAEPVASDGCGTTTVGAVDGERRDRDDRN